MTHKNTDKPLIIIGILMLVAASFIGMLYPTERLRCCKGFPDCLVVFYSSAAEPCFLWRQLFTSFWNGRRVGRDS